MWGIVAVLTICNICSAFLGWVKEEKVITSVVLSIVAATIFFIAFDYIPRRLRARKLKPIVTTDLIQIYLETFQMFEAIMRQLPARPVQGIIGKIHAGTLSLKEIRLGLATKCREDQDATHSVFGEHSLPIWNYLAARAQTATELINKVMAFSEVATTDELATVQNLSLSLKNFDSRTLLPLERSSWIASRTYSLYNYAEPTFRLYKSHMELKALIFNRLDASDNINIALDQVHFLYSKKNYKLCEKLCKKYIRKWVGINLAFYVYHAKCLADRKGSKKFYNKIRSVKLVPMHVKTALLPLSFILVELLADEEMADALGECLGDRSIDHAREILIEHEELVRESTKVSVLILNQLNPNRFPVNEDGSPAYF